MEVFNRISAGGDHVNLEQFTEFLRSTFPDCDEDVHFEERAQVIFRKFCKNDLLSERHLMLLWEAILEKCMKPRSALVVVDFQNDFIDGSLSLKRCPLGHNPETLLPRLNYMISKCDEVAYTLDWHPHDHISFLESRSLWKLHKTNQRDPSTVGVGEELIFEDDRGKPYPQKMWPRHCVEGTEGAAFHKDLILKESSITVHKGTHSKVDSYSAFWDNTHQSETDLRKLLEARRITNLLIVGLAFDACVLATARDAIPAGFTACVVEDLTAGISEAMTLEARAQLSKIHCPALTCEQAEQLLSDNPLPWTFVWQQAESFERQKMVSLAESTDR